MIRKGVTRTVLIIFGLAFKFPSCESYLSFLNGVCANQREYNWYYSLKETKYNHLLCPVYFNLFGLLLIMPQCQEVIVYPAVFFKMRDLFYDITTDLKTENFGIYEDRLVLIDYA